MSIRGSVFSYWQQNEKGIYPRKYSRGDVVVSQSKIKTIEERFNSYNDRLKKIAIKHLSRLRNDIEFYCRMINQEIIENSVIVKKQIYANATICKARKRRMKC